MTNRHFRLFCLFLLGTGSLGVCIAEKGTIEAGPQNLKATTSLGDALSHAGYNPVHILYVHGIGAMGSNDSLQFRKHLCGALKGCAWSPKEKPIRRDYADSGEFEPNINPPSILFLGKQVWETKEEWNAAAPFVDHYVYRRSDGGYVIVDEINWWPLAMALKCRHIMKSEAELVGPNKDVLEICSLPRVCDPLATGIVKNLRYSAYPWIHRDQARHLEAISPKGAFLNRMVKKQIIDWGVPDAFLAVGTIHNLFRDAIRQLFVKSVIFHPDTQNSLKTTELQHQDLQFQQEFVFVTHSLGSYLVFSTIEDDSPCRTSSSNACMGPVESPSEKQAVDYIFSNAYMAYMFANQIPLLEMAKLETSDTQEATQALRPLSDSHVSTATDQHFSQWISKWSDDHGNYKKPTTHAASSHHEHVQIIAWSDTSDLLSWHIPAIAGATVVNLYVRNATRWNWLWLAENPLLAHDNYAVNKNIIRVMMQRTKSERQEGAK